MQPGIEQPRDGGLADTEQKAGEQCPKHVSDASHDDHDQGLHGELDTHRRIER